MVAVGTSAELLEVATAPGPPDRVAAGPLPGSMDSGESEVFDDLVADARVVAARLARMRGTRGRGSVRIPVAAMSMVEDLGAYGA
jgi:hypothetical protein